MTKWFLCAQCDSFTFLNLHTRRKANCFQTQPFNLKKVVFSFLPCFPGMRLAVCRMSSRLQWVDEMQSLLQRCQPACQWLVEFLASDIGYTYIKWDPFLVPHISLSLSPSLPFLLSLHLSFPFPSLSFPSVDVAVPPLLFHSVFLCRPFLLDCPSKEVRVDFCEIAGCAMQSYCMFFGCKVRIRNTS